MINLDVGHAGTYAQPHGGAFHPRPLPGWTGSLMVTKKPRQCSGQKMRLVQEYGVENWDEEYQIVFIFPPDQYMSFFKAKSSRGLH
jgi:hypothetical protein